MNKPISKFVVLYPFTTHEVCDVRKGNAYTVAARRSRAWEWGRNAFFLGGKALPWWGEGRRALVNAYVVFIIGSAFMLAGQACHTPTAAHDQGAATELSAQDSKAAADDKSKNPPQLKAPEQQAEPVKQINKTAVDVTAAGPAEASLVYDHRGAYGPYAFEQLALLADGVKLRCQRQRHRGDRRLQSIQFLLPAKEARLLRERAHQLWATPPAAVAQASTISDFGTFTTTLRFADVRKQLIVSGQMTLQPYPKDLMRQLGELKQRCNQRLDAAEIAVDKALPQAGAAKQVADPAATPNTKESE